MITSLRQRVRGRVVRLGAGNLIPSRHGSVGVQSFEPEKQDWLDQRLSQIDQKLQSIHRFFQEIEIDEDNR